MNETRRNVRKYDRSLAKGPRQDTRTERAGSSCTSGGVKVMKKKIREKRPRKQIELACSIVNKNKATKA